MAKKVSKKAKAARFDCQECGRSHQQWMGRCEGCGSWGTLEETKPESEAPSWNQASQGPVSITEIGAGTEGLRIPTRVPELDRVLGGGLVEGSLVLIGGEPGIGKSTLLTELCGALTRAGKRVLYVAGEESPRQIQLRARRLGALEAGFLIYPEVRVEEIRAQVEKDPPDLLVVDSVQTLRSKDLIGVPGSTAQLASMVQPLLEIAKGQKVPTLLVAHVNKDGDLAGPKLLEHMVDVVLAFEGERDQDLRFLRSFKNRFGPTGELGVFRMGSEGLEAVEDPHTLFLDSERQGLDGAAIAASLEGSRVLLVEVQALVASSTQAYPRRVTQGYEKARLTLLASVMERYLGMDLGREDLFLKLVGGLQIKEPGLDLAAAVALYSSWSKAPVPSKTAFAAEIGLGGELRRVRSLEMRVKEVARLGFDAVVVPKSAKIGKLKGISVKRFESLQEVLQHVFPR